MRKIKLRSLLHRGYKNSLKSISSYDKLALAPHKVCLSHKNRLTRKIYKVVKKVIRCLSLERCLSGFNGEVIAFLWEIGMAECRDGNQVF